ncbi:hypothetical protein ACFFJT_00830 [Dyella flava]|uniref:Transcriptional regulator, TetR family n=1 Tax=Dyella flava TaxID=1920170 RepID=A0ABS2K103_9GAMM|nr:hypothetical protein [Dyella flava]MBM7124935.1 hypothetical protein [Dyella flava]
MRALVNILFRSPSAFSKAKAISEGIAKEAGLARGTSLNHFPRKDDFVVEVIMERISRSARRPGEGRDLVSLLHPSHWVPVFLAPQSWRIHVPPRAPGRR